MKAFFHLSVAWLIRQLVMLLSKFMKNGLLRILNDLDSAGQGRKRDKRKDGQEGKRDEEEGGTRRKERRVE